MCVQNPWEFRHWHCLGDIAYSLQWIVSSNSSMKLGADIGNIIETEESFVPYLHQYTAFGWRGAMHQRKQLDKNLSTIRNCLLSESEFIWIYTQCVLRMNFRSFSSFFANIWKNTNFSDFTDFWYVLKFSYFMPCRNEWDEQDRMFAQYFFRASRWPMNDQSTAIYFSHYKAKNTRSIAYHRQIGTVSNTRLFCKTQNWRICHEWMWL